MAGRTFSAIGDQTVTTTLTTALAVIASAAIRPSIIYAAFSCGTDELDDMLNWQMQRFTVSGGGTSFTPVPLTFEDVASITTATSNSTVEPTYTATEFLMDINVNTRSFQQWYAQPGREMNCAQAADDGIGTGALHATSTPAIVTTQHFVE